MPASAQTVERVLGQVMARLRADPAFITADRPQESDGTSGRPTLAFTPRDDAPGRETVMLTSRTEPGPWEGTTAAVIVLRGAEPILPLR